ncbi:MAG: hypothetical protein ACNI3A_12095 [Desulfovibrio sp.]|uniref:hypothetical protein n=1 Tax=Desulfovibrio sp. 7SRBS1 TaxID=3378064 RepID=UPI003B3C5FB9
MADNTSPPDMTLANALALCRRERNSETSVAYRRLLKTARTDCLDELSLAEGVRVHRLQGAILTITGLLRDIAADPRQPDKHDGAYI